MTPGLARRSIRTLACAAILLLGAASGSDAALKPVRAAATAPPALGATATAALLEDPATGQVLYALHPHRELAIASETKLMTALVTLEHVHRLGTYFTQTDYYPASVDSQIGLVPGERMTVRDLLTALMLPSADDAAEDLAYNVGHGSVAAFLAMMNAEARRLGLRQTHYTSPSGLDTPGNYSTAADLVRLATFDVGHFPFLRRVVSLPSAVLRSGDRLRRVVNTNDLLGRVAWIDGIKTGHTLAAGYVLVASGHRDGMTLVSAVLGTPSEALRDADTLALQAYGFADFRLMAPVRTGAVLGRLPVVGRTGLRATLLAGAQVERVLPRRATVGVSLQAPARLRGPLPAGTRVGTATVRADGRPIGRVPLMLAGAVPAPAASPVAATLGSTPFLVAVVIVLAGGWAWTLRRRGGRDLARRTRAR